MLYVRPDFYDGFRCLADACRHSCCVGWEIDVDAESLAYYKNIDGELGRELRESIALTPTPHFRLAEGTRLADFGTGEIPLRAIVESLLEDGYQGYFSLEWEKMWHPELRDLSEELPLFTAYMREIG